MNHKERGALIAASQMECPLQVTKIKASRTSTAHMLEADGLNHCSFEPQQQLLPFSVGYLFCAPENLASVSGEMKVKLFSDINSFITICEYGIAAC
jgi:hypothetical protein